MNQAALKADVAVSALRGLAVAGYFTPEQLSAMEGVLAGGKGPASNTGRRWLSVSEACRHVKVSRTTLWKYCLAGGLTIHSFGRRKLIEQGELDSFILAGKEAFPDPPPQRRRAELGRRRRQKADNGTAIEPSGRSGSSPVQPPP